MGGLTRALNAVLGPKGILFLSPLQAVGLSNGVNAIAADILGGEG
jgi:hypothetical protein